MLMLRSHRFLYLKTTKTAGTSVEALLEPFCAAPGHVVQHTTQTIVSEFGVVAYRGPKAEEEAGAFFNHMGARAVRELLPREFASFHKIGVVRNPYDKCISQFHMKTGLTAATAKVMRDSNPQSLKELFAEFSASGFWTDRDILFIDGELILDTVIRYERLLDDLRELNVRLGLGLNRIEEALPSFKISDRSTQVIPWTDYMDRRVQDLIESEFDWYFDHFGYPRWGRQSLNGGGLAGSRNP